MIEIAIKISLALLYFPEGGAKLITTARFCVVATALALAGCGQQAQSVPAASESLATAREARPQAAVTSGQTASVEGTAVTITHPSACPWNAVYIRLDTEIRGYPSTASGITVPCTIIGGPTTQLSERGPIVVSKHGYIHSLSFQSNGTNGMTIQASAADGNVAPTRLADVDQDHVALAVDSLINDYIVASQAYEYDNCWYVVRNFRTKPSSSSCDTNVNAIHALAMDAADELVVAGTDVHTGQGRIDVFAGAALHSPRLLRSIEGPATGLASLSGTLGYFNISLSLATDPRSGAIYVYDRLVNDSGSVIGPAKISEFGPDANGNVAPQRTLSGPQIGLIGAAYGLDVLAVNGSGTLFVLTGQTSPTVAVFGREARGNVLAQRSFGDPSATIGSAGAALAVR